MILWSLSWLDVISSFFFISEFVKLNIISLYLLISWKKGFSTLLTLSKNQESLRYSLCFWFIDFSLQFDYFLSSTGKVVIRDKGNCCRFPTTELKMMCGFNLRNNGGEVCLPSAYLLPWEEQALCQQRVAARVGDLGQGNQLGEEGQKGTICGNFKRWEPRGQERLPLVLCRRAGGETMRLGLRERREKRSAGSLPGFQADMA